MAKSFFAVRLRPAATWTAWSFLLLAFGAATAFFRSFAEKKPFDDEGLLVEWLKTFMEGHPLYKDVHCFYGPAYFLYEWIGHVLLTGRALPTHDSIRMVSIACWIATALLVFVLIRCLTGSWLLALAAHFVVFRAARFLGEEPGHPQDLILLLVIAVLAVALVPLVNTTRLFLLGAITGILLLTKINAGLLVGLSLSVAFAFALPAAQRKWAGVGCLLALSCFTPLLLWPNLAMAWAKSFLFLEQASLLAVVITIWPGKPDSPLTVKPLLFAAFGFGVAVSALIAFAIVHGASPASMFEWMIVKPHSIMGAFWYVSPNITAPYLISAIAGVFLALLARTRFATRPRMAALQVSAGLTVFFLAATQRYHALFCLAPPFLWCFCRAGLPAGHAPLARNLLALTGVLFTLYAYPVAGAHIRFVDIALIVVYTLVLHDGLNYWRQNLAFRIPRRLISLLSPACIALILLADAASLVRARNRYQSLTPLNLPGTTLVRLSADEAHGLERIVAESKRACSTLTTVPGMPSFNQWTGLNAARRFPFANWVTGFNDDAQRDIIRDISADSRPCIVYNPQMVGFWTHNADVAARPIIRYLQQEFRPLMEAQGNRLMVRIKPE